MTVKRIFAGLMAAFLLFALTGCFGMGDDPSENSSSVSEPAPEDQLVIYHNNNALSPMLTSLAEGYSQKTGKTLTPKLAGNDYMGEVKSQNPGLYIVDTNEDLSSWHEEGLFSDLMNTEGLNLPSVPSGLQLNPNGIGSYGVPLKLEGFGYIVNRDMFSALFEGDASALIEDLRTCSYTDFEGFVTAVDTYIKAPTAAKITVNGNEYTFKAEKDPMAKTLTGVFAINNEGTETLEKLLSVALSANFQSRYEVLSAGEESLSGIGPTVGAYMDALDMHTTHIASMDGTISRGEEFSGGDYNYSTAIDLFANGYALFYPGSTAHEADFKKAVPGFGENLDILPMKLPLSDEQITASGLTAEKLQSSIIISSRYYLALNPKAEGSAAMDFLNGLYSGESPFNDGFYFGQGSMNSEDHGTMPETSEGSSSGEEENPLAEGEGPHSTEGEESSPESESSSSAPKTRSTEKRTLTEALQKYYESGNWLPDMSASLPADFNKNVLENGISDYWGMETWSDRNRNDFIDKIINGWRDLLDEMKTAVG